MDSSSTKKEKEQQHHQTEDEEERGEKLVACPGKCLRDHHGGVKWLQHPNLFTSVAAL